MGLGYASVSVPLDDLSEKTGSAVYIDVSCTRMCPNRCEGDGFEQCLNVKTHSSFVLRHTQHIGKGFFVV